MAEHWVTVEERQEGYGYDQIYRAVCQCGWFSPACNSEDAAVAEVAKHESELSDG